MITLFPPVIPDAALLAKVRPVEQYPPAVRHLSYNGDHRATVGKWMGPNLDNEYYTVVSCDYTTGLESRSRLGLAYGLLKLIPGDSANGDARR